MLDLVDIIERRGSIEEKAVVRDALNMLPKNTFGQIVGKPEKIVASLGVRNDIIDIDYFQEKNNMRVINLPSKTNYHEDLNGKHFSFKYREFTYDINIPNDTQKCHP